MEIAFKRLTEVDKSDIIDLMNNPLVGRQMPLLKGGFGDIDCDQFIANKEQLWAAHGYGPWAFVVDGRFAGWGGIQPEGGEVDLAMVLHPDFWGIGKVLYKKIITSAFVQMGFSSITGLLPPTRTRVKGLLRLGFEVDQVVSVGNEQFIRYRLEKGALPEI